MGAAARLDTRLTRLLGIEHPVIQEGLGPYKTVRLAAAVSNAGGLGTLCIPGLTKDTDEGARTLRAYVEDVCELTERPFAVNVPVGTVGGEPLPSTDAYLRAVVDARRDRAVADRLTVVTTSAGPPSLVRPLLADSGLIHMHKVGGTRQAVRAQADGVDVVIASGYEAGGGTHAKPVHTFVLGPSVADAVDVPVVLAGGIRDGRGLAAALALGADGVALGTRFVASHDNPDWHGAYAERILAAKEGDDTFFPAVYAPCRSLRTEGSDELLALLRSEAPPGVEELTRWKDERLIAAQRDGDVVGGLMPCGQVASGITELVHVAEFVPGIVEEAIAVVDRLRGLAEPAAASVG